VYFGYSLRRPIGGEADPAELQRSAMVRAAVNRGEAPSDPSLAEETVALARMRQDPPGLRHAWLFFAGIDGVLLAMAWGRARAGSLGDAAVIGVLPSILMPLMVWMRHRYTQRARRAAAAAVRQMTA